MGHWSFVALMLGCCLSVVLSDNQSQQSNAIRLPGSQPFSKSTRPPFYDKARRARYIVHKANWTVIATFSTKPELVGRSFPAPASISDGPVGKSSGTPYFYLAAIDSIMHDVAKNPNVTLSFSEAAFSDIAECAVTSTSDPESPLCARLMLFGQLVNVTDPKETSFAKEALFSRHPLMPTWPKDHDFGFKKLIVTDVWILDFYGGGSSVSVDDYYNALP
ncbi:protein CREG1-like [Lytechinus variegatus]|uniref:protein CREG1-like n=1 Tax=Lytechinus variegatus TaxID=7654 RepID=UPI001BB27201|nr:protein CREG1-like [Lytechinus variegatus]XP_041482932.1 protein CREG1-like [Lytechinus variegatus]XP_041482933.1 protein CREG1-like [Lytechinus variegatus]